MCTVGVCVVCSVCLSVYGVSDVVCVNVLCVVWDVCGISICVCGTCGVYVCM